MVGHEEGVELAALKRLREALQMLEIEVGVRVFDGSSRAFSALEGILAPDGEAG